MTKLKPCPFCGGEAEIVGGPENWTPTFCDPDSGGDPIAVVCKTCACGTRRHREVGGYPLKQIRYVIGSALIAGDWRGKEEIMIKLGLKQYRISYLLKKWFRSQFSKYNPEVNRKCMISKKCKNRWNIIKCGECWRADRFIR